MSGLLFDRVVKVTAYEARSAPTGALGGFFDLIPNALEIVAMRVQFSIEKTLGGKPNTCQIVISNLSDDARSWFERRPMQVRLDAGYDGEYRHMFAGDIRFSQSQRRGTDWETTLQLADGDRAFRHARTNRSYPEGTPVKTVLRDAAKSMGLILPEAVLVSRELDRQFASGYALNGPTRNELTRLLAPFGYSWSIQSGVLQILRDEDVSPAQTIVISQEAGMVEIPAFNPPDAKTKRPTLEVKTLLYPEVTPGGLIRLDSGGDITERRAKYNGVYKVARVTHTGDTHGDDWTTEIEANPR